MRGDDVEGVYGVDVLLFVLFEFYFYFIGWYCGYDMNLFVCGVVGFIFIFC